MIVGTNEIPLYLCLTKKYLSPEYCNSCFLCLSMRKSTLKLHFFGPFEVLIYIFFYFVSEYVVLLYSNAENAQWIWQLFSILKGKINFIMVRLLNKLYSQFLHTLLSLVLSIEVAWITLCAIVSWCKEVAANVFMEPKCGLASCFISCIYRANQFHYGPIA